MEKAPSKTETIIGVLIFGGFLYAASLVLSVLFGSPPQPPSPYPQPTQAPAAGKPITITDPDILRQQREAKELDSFNAMSVKEKSKYLQDKLLDMCQKQMPLLNFMRVEQRGNGIYCVHSFLNEYSLDAGSLGPVMQAWTGAWSVQLAAAKITRVGVYGTGEGASGTWFNMR